MSEPMRKNQLGYWIAAAALLVLLVGGGIAYLVHGDNGTWGSGRAEGHEAEAVPASAGMITVSVIHPQKGMDYVVEQPGSVRAFETVQVLAKASGFLKEQSVDIGDRVKKGQVLAVIAVPEIEKQLQHNKASLEQSKARIKQMEARVESAKADHEAALAAVVQADAAHKSAQAWVRYRNKQYQRMTDLFASTSIEEKLVDESKERKEASVETEHATKAAIATTNANVKAAIAKIDQAKADVVGARSEVDVVQADIEKTQVLLDYATIRAEFDGKITRRTYFPGAFIRTASESGTQDPLLTLQRTDKFRVVVQVPDSAVPYLDVGDEAIVRVDSLPGRTFPGKLARKADSEDPNTRLMHIEIDLENPTGEINDGMYGKVQIMLDRFPKMLSIPSSSTVHNAKGHTAVFVVRAGRAHLTEVTLGKDNAGRVVVVSGLTVDDLVVRSPASAGLTDGTAVHPRVLDAPARAGAEEKHH